MMGTMGAAAVGAVAGTMAGNALAGSASDKDAKAKKEAEAQTAEKEAQELQRKADEAKVPVLKFTELVPDGDTYLTWMQANVKALADTLSR